MPTAPTSSGQRKAYAVLALGVFAIGWSALFVRWSAVPGWTSAFWRMALAQVVFVPWALAARPAARPRPSRAATRDAVVAGVFFAADLALFNTAVMVSSAANATLLGTNAPIFVALGAWLLYRDRPTRRFWAGFALSFVGMIAIVGTDVVRHPHLGLGDAFAVGGAACYAGYLLYVRRSRQEIDALTFSAISGVAAAATLLLICVIIGTPLHGYPARSWWAMIGLALVTQVVGHLSVAYALGRLPVSRTSIALLGQAPLTAILAVPLLGERLSAQQVLGGALVLGGIYVVNRLPRATAVEPEPLME
ncbi:MAG: DMT family transporter [Gemmatimonadaceae bacterium]|nr:DMT family transporter [Gemmatimonadaceae bacterium]NUO95943.1 DMT family transporter [Gemmatimonadaceae bacterium]NUP54440.1 DMT family transporter [Gemmatimonadaceae bacterium]NUS32692.1 DMT family transporter [Gemmatimonadaceae bacterium]NUS48430.1 DMT family transporter [Gemmatimonadaceae bacterium]